MARDKLVQTLGVWLPTAAGVREKIVVKIFYDASADMFYAPVPQHMAPNQYGGRSKTLNDAGQVVTERHVNAHICGRSPREVQEKVYAAGAAYEKAVTNSQKVIVYKMAYATLDKDGRRTHEGGLAFEDGLGLTIDWATGYEIRVGTAEPTVYAYDPTATQGHILNQSVIGGSEYTAIRWSQAREDFFRSVDERLVAMVARLRDFLKDGPALEQAIDRGDAKFMLGHESTPDQTKAAR